VGINEGIRASNGEFVVVVDDDNILAPEAIGEMASTFASNQLVGVVGPICYYLSQPKTIMYAGARLSRVARRAKMIGQGQIDRGQFDERTRVEMFPNCFAVRRSSVSGAPLIDTWRLPFFNDDASLQLSLSRRGFCVVLNPRARIWHDYPVEIDEDRTWTSPFRVYYTVRSKIYLERGFDSWAGKLGFSFCYVGYVFGYLAKILSARAGTGDKRACLSALVRAITHGVTGRGGSPLIQ
jgi:GT2 family glycosyltransferase